MEQIINKLIIESVKNKLKENNVLYQDEAVEELVTFFFTHDTYDQIFKEIDKKADRFVKEVLRNDIKNIS